MIELEVFISVEKKQTKKPLSFYFLAKPQGFFSIKVSTINVLTTALFVSINAFSEFTLNFSRIDSEYNFTFYFDFDVFHLRFKLIDLYFKTNEIDQIDSVKYLIEFY